jgi:hypothetical protein
MGRITKRLTHLAEMTLAGGCTVRPEPYLPSTKFSSYYIGNSIFEYTELGTRYISSTDWMGKPKLVIQSSYKPQLAVSSLELFYEPRS